MGDDPDPAGDLEVTHHHVSRTRPSRARRPSAPTTSTAPAAMAASGCSAAGPMTTIGVARLAMIRSMASRPPHQRSRSSRTAAGLEATTSSSAATGLLGAAADDEPGLVEQLLEHLDPRLACRRRSPPGPEHHEGAPTVPGSWVSCDAGTGPPATAPSVGTVSCTGVSSGTGRHLEPSPGRGATGRHSSTKTTGSLSISRLRATTWYVAGGCRLLRGRAALGWDSLRPACTVCTKRSPGSRSCRSAAPPGLQSSEDQTWAPPEVTRSSLAAWPDVPAAGLLRDVLDREGEGGRPACRIGLGIGLDGHLDRRVGDTPVRRPRSSWASSTAAASATSSCWASGWVTPTASSVGVVAVRRRRRPGNSHHTEGHHHDHERGAAATALTQ